jgi:hypothetical protein
MNRRNTDNTTAEEKGEIDKRWSTKQFTEVSELRK